MAAAAAAAVDGEEDGDLGAEEEEDGTIHHHHIVNPRETASKGGVLGFGPAQPPVPRRVISPGAEVITTPTTRGATITMGEEGVVSGEEEEEDLPQVGETIIPPPLPGLVRARDVTKARGLGPPVVVETRPVVTLLN